MPSRLRYRLCRSQPSPGDPVLDVVEKALRHERVLVQVDQVGCLGEARTQSPRCTATPPASPRGPQLLQLPQPNAAWTKRGLDSNSAPLHASLLSSSKDRGLGSFSLVVWENSCCKQAQHGAGSCTGGLQKVRQRLFLSSSCFRIRGTKSPCFPPWMARGQMKHPKEQVPARRFIQRPEALPQVGLHSLLSLLWVPSHEPQPLCF